MSKIFLTAALGSALALCSAGAIADESGDAGDSASAEATPLHDGAYFAPMASYLFTGDKRTKDGLGGVLAGGYSFGRYAFEMKGIYTSISEKGSDTNEAGGSLGLVVFPFSSLPNLFGLVEVGGLQVKLYPTSTASTETFSATTAAAGLGYLFPLQVGNYEFAIRAESLYRWANRESSVKPGPDLDVDRSLNDVMINVGLQLPLTKKAPPPPPPEPVRVVPAPVDSDGDGVPDERDQCPNTPIGTQVDELGCPLTPPCKSPEEGQRLSLEGCKTGDTIVLRGVNFEFDKTRLTVNAKTILDGVADALNAHPDIHVELGGHTDSLGSDDYNQRLSDQRAAAVLAYLGGKGIAADRMVSAGYGESLPVDSNESEEGRERNRRVELKITSGGAAETASAAPSADAAPVSPVDAAPAAAAGPSAEDLAPAP